MQVPLLSALMVWPVCWGLVTLWIPSARTAARAAAWGAWGAVWLSVGLWWGFDPTVAAYQWTEQHAWIPMWGASYAVGVDGVALWLVCLTAWITAGVVWAARDSVQVRLPMYLGSVLILSGLMQGVFLARDAILFYVFWEAMLIPMLLLIGIWGGEGRREAATQFFLYTLLGSVCMLGALVFLSHVSGSTAIDGFYHVDLTPVQQRVVLVALLIAFAVKIPMFPVHTWLPRAHVEAPTGGSVLLAAIMLKMGGYGLVRLAMPIAPDAWAWAAPVLVVLSLVAVVYISLVALAQHDMKKLIAYSSIAHMGFVTLGLCVGVWNRPMAVMAMEGAMFQMISHGFISGALFFCVGVLYDRMHSRAMDRYGGVASVMPRFAGLFLLFAMANAGLPGTSGFVGELLVLLACVPVHIGLAMVAGTIMVWGAGYTLWLYKRVMWGPAVHERVLRLREITVRERALLGSLAAMVLVCGVYPKVLLDPMHASMIRVAHQVFEGQ